MRCPDCGKEFEDKEGCPICGKRRIGKPRLEWALFPEKPSKDWPRDSTGQPVTPAFLTHSRGLNLEDAMIVSFLAAFDIPSVCIRPNDGDFGKIILGVSGSGVDIYVPEALLETAKELLEENMGDMEDYEEL